MLPCTEAISIIPLVGCVVLNVTNVIVLMIALILLWIGSGRRLVKTSPAPPRKNAPDSSEPGIEESFNQPYDEQGNGNHGMMVGTVITVSDFGVVSAQIGQLSFLELP